MRNFNVFFAVIFLLFSQAAVSQQNCPLRLITQPFVILGKTVYQFDFFAVEDQVVIVDVVVNDGRCKINKNAFPISLKYNQSYSDSFGQCGQVWKVEIFTQAQGSWIFNYNG